MSSFLTALLYRRQARHEYSDMWAFPALCIDELHAGWHAGWLARKDTIGPAAGVGFSGMRM